VQRRNHGPGSFVSERGGEAAVEGRPAPALPVTAALCWARPLLSWLYGAVTAQVPELVNTSPEQQTTIRRTVP
jgi:hypothetical protein